MTPQVIEVTRPQAPAADGPVRDGAPADGWSELIRALAGTDDDELPIFGRLPG